MYHCDAQAAAHSDLDVGVDPVYTRDYMARLCKRPQGRFWSDGVRTREVRKLEATNPQVRQ